MRTSLPGSGDDCTVNRVDTRITEMGYGDFELRPVAEAFNEQPHFMQNWESYKGKGVDIYGYGLRCRLAALSLAR